MREVNERLIVAGVRAQQLADEAEAERRRLQQVLDTLPEGIIIVDVTGRVTALNATAADILGDRPNLPGLRAAIVAGVAGAEPPDLAPDPDVAIARYLDGSLYPVAALPLVRAVVRGEVVRGEQFLLRHHRTGQDVPVLANAAPLRNPDGQVVGGVVAFQDITTLKEFERARDEFLSAASHDLKTPLTAIRGLTQLVLRQRYDLPEPERARLAERLKGIVAATRRMDTLINELLDVAALQMGRSLELMRRPTDLVALVRAVVAEQRSNAGRHRLVFETGEPVLMADVDHSRLGRAIGNLLDNALKYSPGGGVVSVRLRRQLIPRAAAGESSGDAAPPSAWAEIEVSDQGVGVPPADLPLIFERFHRGGNVVGRIAGTGIGLASAQQIVKHHGGEISVTSREGAGSTFTIRLPLGPA